MLSGKHNYGVLRMPKSPKGQKRPADVTSNAVKIARIATGEEPDELTDDGKNKAAQSLSTTHNLSNFMALLLSLSKAATAPLNALAQLKSTSPATLTTSTFPQAM